MLILGMVPKWNLEKNRYQFSSKLMQSLSRHKVSVLMLMSVDDCACCDGFILAGGKDVDPARYHTACDPHTILEDEKIEELELEVVLYAKKHQIPLLGICRGMQVIQVACGGILHQHIVNHQACWHTLKRSPWNLKIQHVYSDHHQCIENPPSFFHICATSEDEIIEAFESHPFYGVQWHPEMDEQDEVLPFFLQRVLDKKRNQHEYR